MVLSIQVPGIKVPRPMAKKILKLRGATRYEREGCFLCPRIQKLCPWRTEAPQNAVPYCSDLRRSATLE